MPEIFTSEEKAKKEKTFFAASHSGAVNEGSRPRIGVRESAVSRDKEVTIEERHDLPGHSHSPLSAFCYFPDRINFIQQDKEEQVVLLLRRHPITNLGWIITSFFLLIAPGFVSVLPAFEALPPGFKTVSYMLWYLIIFSFIYEKFLSWFYNVNVVTDERIFDVDFVHLIYREITDANLDQIQDVTVTIGGGIRTIFNYGDVIIQTAAEIPQIEFEAVPNPDGVAKILRELRVEEEVEKIEGRVR